MWPGMSANLSGRGPTTSSASRFFFLSYALFRHDVPFVTLRGIYSNPRMWYISNETAWIMHIPMKCIYSYRQNYTHLEFYFCLFLSVRLSVWMFVSFTLYSLCSFTAVCYLFDWGDIVVLWDTFVVFTSSL